MTMLFLVLALSLSATTAIALLGGDVSTLTLNTSEAVIQMGTGAEITATAGGDILLVSHNGSVVIDTSTGLFTLLNGGGRHLVSTDTAGVSERASIRASAAAAARRDVTLTRRGPSVSSASSVPACNTNPGVIPPTSLWWETADAVPLLVLTAPSRCHASTFVPGTILTFGGGGWTDVTAAAAVQAPDLYLMVTSVGPTQTAGWITWTSGGGTGDTFVLRLAYQPLEHLGTTCDLLVHAGGGGPLSNWTALDPITCHGITCGGAMAVPGVGTVVVTGGFTVGSGIEATTSSVWLQNDDGGGGNLSPLASIQRALVVDVAFVGTADALFLCVDATGDDGGLWGYTWAVKGDPTSDLSSGAAAAALPGSGPCASVVSWVVSGSGGSGGDDDTECMVSSRTSAPPGDGTPDLFVWTRRPSLPDRGSWTLRQRIPFDATTAGSLRVDTLGPSPAVVTACGARAGTNVDPNAAPALSPGCFAFTWSRVTQRLVATDALTEAGAATGTWWGVSATPWRDADTGAPRLVVASAAIPEALEEGGNTTMYIVS